MQSTKQPLMLCKMSLSLFAAVEDSAPAIFAGNMSIGIEEMVMHVAQTTKPSHQAPIHRGSCLSMPGSGYNTP